MDPNEPNLDLAKGTVYGTIGGGFSSGDVMVCIDRRPVPLADSGAVSPLLAPFSNNVYSVQIANHTFRDGEDVLVVLSNGRSRRTAHIVASVPVAADRPAPSCDTTTDSGYAVQITPDLHEGDNRISGIAPGPGTIAVCVNGTQKQIADATAQIWGNTLDVTGGKLNLALSPNLALSVKDQVILSWRSQNRTARAAVQGSVAPPVISLVNLQSDPKEGQDVIYVVGEVPAGSVAAGKTGMSLQVVVNEQVVDLRDSKQNIVKDVALDVSGEQGIHLVRPLDAGDCVAVMAFPAGQPPVTRVRGDFRCVSLHNSPHPAQVGAGYRAGEPRLANSLFDFGRVRGYMAAGSIFSYDNSSFSAPSIFLALNVTKNWLWAGPWHGSVLVDDRVRTVDHYKRFMFDTFFEARLTSLPVASCSTSSSTSSGTTTGTPTVTPGGTPAPAASASCLDASKPDLSTLVSTRKAAALIGGATLPIVMSTWMYDHRPYALAFGPIAKIGLDTPTDSGAAKAGTIFANQNEFYTNFGFGARLGLYRMSHSTYVAPENMMYFDVIAGRFSNFDITPPAGQRYNRPWRFGFEGYLKVPTTPFILGFSANIHQNFGLGNSNTVDGARDDLRFLFGAKFDAGKLFSVLPALK